MADQNERSLPATRTFTAPNGERYVLSWSSGRAGALAQPIDSETGTTSKSRNPYYVSQQLQELHLTGASGDKSAFVLTDFNATAAEGDLVTLVSASSKGREQPTAIALRNETTGESFFSKTEITTLVQPSWLKPKYLTPIVVACMFTAGALLLALLPVLLISGRIAKKRAAAFVDSFQFD